MSDNNETFKWLKVFLLLTFFVSNLISGVCAEEEAEDSPSYDTQPLAPPQCPPNEVYYQCLPNCRLCENRPNYCQFDCTAQGCDCIHNFARLTPDGPCEPVEKCPRPSECGENEVYRDCGSMCEFCAWLPCREQSCEYRCYCKEGYIRDNTGKCIDEDTCPDKLDCLTFEELLPSGPMDEYCLHADTETISNDTLEEEGCYCQPGLKRNIHGYCIDERYCTIIQCEGPYEEYQPCPRKCDTTCRNYMNPDCKEDNQCYPACFCPEGYVFNDYRVCVKPEECPPGTNPKAPPLTTPSPGEENTSEDQITATEPPPPPAEEEKATTIEETQTTKREEEVATTAEAKATTESPAPQTTKAPKKSRKKGHKAKAEEGPPKLSIRERGPPPGEVEVTKAPASEDTKATSSEDAKASSSEDNE